MNREIPEWGRPLNDNELHAEMMADLFVGGSETTTNALAAGVILLIEHPEVWQQLTSDPQTYLPTFCEEVLRVEGPVQGLLREAAVDVELHGVKIPAGSILMLRYGAGNRDDRMYECPADIDLDRKHPRRHLAFGVGTHHCLGAPLARRELSTASRRSSTSSRTCGSSRSERLHATTRTSSCAPSRSCTSGSSRGPCPAAPQSSGRSTRSRVERRASMMLEGKVAIVTGAGQGIGAATAHRMAEEGASVVVSDVADESAKAVVAEIEAAGGKAVFVHCDVSELEDVKGLMAATIEAFGKLDILHNNAGVHETNFTTSAQSHELPEDVWDKVIGINLRGPWMCSKYAAPLLKDAGGGVIVNAASIGGMVGYPMGGAYGPSKAGLIQLTRVMAIELAPQNTRVVCYAPGNTDTPMVQKYYNQPGLSDEESGWCRSSSSARISCHAWDGPRRWRISSSTSQATAPR